MKTLIFSFFCLISFVSVQSQGCQNPETSVYYWTPSEGSIPRFVATSIKENTTEGFIIILGKTEKGIYTVEGGIEDDARGLRFANLAFNSFEGQRQIYSLFDGDFEENYIDDETAKKSPEEKSIHQLWKYHNENIYTQDSLKPLYYLTEYDSAELRIKDDTKNVEFVWNYEIKSLMCWCLFDWAVKKAETE